MNKLVLSLCFLVALVQSQVIPPAVPVQGPTGILGPVPLPAMIPGIINPSLNPFVTGPLNGLLSSPIFNMGLLVPSPLLPFGRRAGVGKRATLEKDDKKVEEPKIEKSLLQLLSENDTKE